MPFKYHPPTRSKCEICEKITRDSDPIVSNHDGKASSANNFPIHNWYNFVLGYTPEFPEYILEREGITSDNFVVDPFVGSGTTLVSCKQQGVPSSGIDANDYFTFVAKTKLEWNIDTRKLIKSWRDIESLVTAKFKEYNWPDDEQLPLLEKSQGTLSYAKYANENRPEMLKEKYISDAPFTKFNLIKNVIEEYNFENKKLKDIFLTALTSIIVPISNVSYGPGFGVRKPKVDVNVYALFKEKLERIINDLQTITPHQNTPANIVLGDARKMSDYYEPNSVDLMITSPPYPGDHEYTKHSRLELILLEYATDLMEFRKIKKRMLRGSTTNIYKDDKEGKLVQNICEIQQIADEIDKRIKADGGTSGFEKLYSKLVREYFGGMHNVFTESYKVLKPGGKFSLLVSDSHAFKMVHIQTAKLLSQVAESAGFVNPHIELWQYKKSTSHKYKLFEDILTIEKPSV